MLPVLLTFVGIVALICGSYWLLVLQPEAHEQGQLRKRLKGVEPGRARRATPAAPLLKAPELLSSIPLFNSLLNWHGITAPLKAAIDRSGVPLTVGRFTLLSATLGLGAYLATYIYFHLWWVSVAAFAAASWIPMAVVRQRSKSRVRKFEEQFPEAIELIARSLRAGHA